MRGRKRERERESEYIRGNRTRADDREQASSAAGNGADKEGH